MGTKHTPTPWKVDGSYTTVKMWISDANRKRICTMQPMEYDNDRAQHIVHCVNSHDALVARVAELEAALQRLDHAYTADYEKAPDISLRLSYETNSQAHAQARAALAKGRT